MQKSKIKNQKFGSNFCHGKNCFYNFTFCTLHFDFERKRKGFTLIETIIAIAVLGILVILALNGLSSFRASNELLRSADTVVGTIKDARSRTLASQNNNQYGVFFNQNQNQISLFAGGYYNAATPANEITNLPSQIEISLLSLTNATTAIAFARLSGDPSATGTVILRIKGTTTRTKTIQINDSGNIEIK